MKKILILVALLALLTASVSADTHIYLGGQIMPKGEDTNWGGGFMVAGMQKISPNIYVLGEYEAFRTEEVNVDNVTGELCFVTNVLIAPLNAHFFARPGIGFTKTEGEKGVLGKQFVSGFSFDMSKETMLWLGAGYSDNKYHRVWSLEVALSWDVDWK